MKLIFYLLVFCLQAIAVDENNTITAESDFNRKGGIAAGF